MGTDLVPTSMPSTGPSRDYSQFRRAQQSLMPLPAEIEAMLKEKYDMNAVALARSGARWSAELKRIYLPIYNQDRVVVGASFRTLDPKIKPKSWVVMERVPEQHKMSLYPTSITPWRNLLIVEDQLSAITSCCMDISTVALLGSTTNIDAVRMLSNLKPNRVIVCLDADALSKGIEFNKKYGDMFLSCQVVKPPKDLKDMSQAERIQFLRRSFAYDD